MTTVATDGRTARAERTRRAVVDAHIALLRAGVLKPTGAQVAEQAGVSLRALWANFNDLDTVMAHTGAEMLRRQDELFVPVSPRLPLPERIDGFCRQRARMLEFVAPYARAAVARQQFSDALRTHRRYYIARVTDEGKILFARELSALDERRRARLVCALGATATWASWAVLRDELQLEVGEATAVLRQSVAGLLAGVTA